MTSHRTPNEVVTLYCEKAWNECQTDLIREITADPVVRHYAGRIQTMDHDTQIARIQDRHKTARPRFDGIIQFAEGPWVAYVWNNTTEQGGKKSGIEIFKVEEGRITEVWNPSTVDEGHWA